MTPRRGSGAPAASAKLKKSEKKKQRESNAPLGNFTREGEQEPDGSRIEAHNRYSARRRVWRNEDGDYHREDGPAVIDIDSYELKDGNGVRQEWRQNGQLHREDGPAVIDEGLERYYKNGQLHREDGPAVRQTAYAVASKYLDSRGYWEEPDTFGQEEWYKDGELHRDDGPARILSDGGEEWYQNGVLHREDGPARIWPNGREEWYKNGVLHREDGPAIKRPADVNLPLEEWYQNGKLERQDGPARIWPDETEEWYRNGDLHRDYGPAIVRSEEVAKKKNIRPGPLGFADEVYWLPKEEWYREGELHREDGPARTFSSGKEEWYKDDKLHREDGPAIVRPEAVIDGNRIPRMEAWYLCNIRFVSTERRSTLHPRYMRAWKKAAKKAKRNASPEEILKPLIKAKDKEPGHLI